MKKRLLTKNHIANIQLWLGVVLFIITIVSSIFVVKEMYVGSLERGVIGVTETWGVVSNDLGNLGVNDPEIMGLIVNNITLQGMIIKTTGVIFLTCAVILLVFSLILILQGLYHLAQK